MLNDVGFSCGTESAEDDTIRRRLRFVSLGKGKDWS